MNEEDGKYLEVVGCDGRRLSVVRVPVRAHGGSPARTTKPVKKGAPPNEGVPIVVNKATSTLLRIAVAAGDTSVGLCVVPGDPIDLERNTHKPARIQAVTRAAVLTAQAPEGRYPNWREVFPPEEVVAEFTADDASALGALLATAVAATDTEHKGVDLTMAGGCVMIESESDTKGKSRVSLVGLEMAGKGSVTVDGLMLRQFFDVIGHERLRVRFHGPKCPLVFHARPDHDFILMPLTRDDRAVKPAPAPAQVEPPEPECKGDVKAEPKAPAPPLPAGAHENNGQAR